MLRSTASLSYHIKKTSCETSKDSKDAFAILETDLERLGSIAKINAYQALVQEYRRQGRAAQRQGHPVCHDVRNIYLNSKCEQFENLQEGLPIYHSAEIIHQRRDQKNQRLVGSQQ